MGEGEGHGVAARVIQTFGNRPRRSSLRTVAGENRFGAAAEVSTRPIRQDEVNAMRARSRAITISKFAESRGQSGECNAGARVRERALARNAPV